MPARRGRAVAPGSACVRARTSRRTPVVQSCSRARAQHERPPDGGRAPRGPHGRVASVLRRAAGAAQAYRSSDRCSIDVAAYTHLLSRVTPLLCPLLVGRDDLLDLADRRIAETLEGHGHLLLLAGEAG